MNTLTDFTYTTLFRSLCATRAKRSIRCGAGSTRGSRRSGEPSSAARATAAAARDRKSTRLNSSHLVISYAVFCFKKNIKLIINISDIIKIKVNDEYKY